MTVLVTFPCHLPQWPQVQMLILDLLVSLDTEELDPGQVVARLEAILNAARPQDNLHQQQEGENHTQPEERSKQEVMSQQEVTSQQKTGSAECDHNIGKDGKKNRKGKQKKELNKKAGDSARAGSRRRGGNADNNWVFNGLQYFLEVTASLHEREVFMKTTLPTVLKLVLRLEEVLPEDGVDIAVQQHACTLALQKDLVSSIIACGFLCLFPDTKDYTGDTKLHSINFDNFFTYLKGSRSPSQSAKLRCILHYFNRVALADFHMAGDIRYIRKVLKKDETPDLTAWVDCEKPLCQIHVHHDRKIEDVGSEAIQVDFANRFIGGGVLVGGRVQEEIRFCISPELIASLLFMEFMMDNEAISIEGTTQFSDYTGYAESFRFAGDHHVEEKQDVVVCAIDATRFGHQGAYKQYTADMVLREVNKALVGFKQSEIETRQTVDSSVTLTLADFTSTLAKAILASAMADAMQLSKGTKEEIEENENDNMAAENDLANQAPHDHLQPIGICNHSHLNVPVDVQSLWMNQFRRRSSNLSDISSRRSSYSTRQSSDFSTDFEEYYEGFQQKEMKKRHSTIKEESSTSQPRLSDFATALISQLMEDSWKVVQQSLAGVQAFDSCQPAVKMVRPLPTRGMKGHQLAAISQESSQDLSNSSGDSTTEEESTEQERKVQFDRLEGPHIEESTREYVNSLVEGAVSILRANQSKDLLPQVPDGNSAAVSRTDIDPQDSSIPHIQGKHGTNCTTGNDLSSDLDICDDLGLCGKASSTKKRLHSSTSTGRTAQPGGKDTFAQVLLQKVLGSEAGCQKEEELSAKGVESSPVNQCTDSSTGGMVGEIFSKTLNEATQGIAAVLRGPIASGDELHDLYEFNDLDLRGTCPVDLNPEERSWPPPPRACVGESSMQQDNVPNTNYVDQCQMSNCLALGESHQSFSVGTEVVDGSEISQAHRSHAFTTQYRNLDQYSSTCAKIVLLDAFSVLRKFYKLHSDWKDKRRGSVPLTKDSKNIGAEILAGEFAKGFRSDELTRFAEDLVKRSSMTELNKLPRRGSCGFRDATLSDFAEQLMHSSSGSPSFEMFQKVQNRSVSTSHRKSFDFGNLSRGGGGGSNGTCLYDQPSVVSRRGSTGGIKMRDIFNLKPFTERLSDYADDIVNEVIHDVFVRLSRSETCTSESEYEDHDCSACTHDRDSDVDNNQEPALNNMAATVNLNDNQSVSVLADTVDNFAQTLSSNIIHSAVSEVVHEFLPLAPEQAYGIPHDVSHDQGTDQSEDEWSDAASGPDIEAVAKEVVSAAINTGVERYIAEMDIQLPIATGNWGCGAFGGDPQLKAMIQWMAASSVDAPYLAYFTFGDERMIEFEAVVKYILGKGWAVGDLMQAVLNYCDLATSEYEESHMVTTQFFQYIFML
ncbi:uncharacterized protein LOC106166730 isoform X2 [Lingula anatina]|uniref:poly(ADP-ribose) glycohydrolase n=1 Tax=Lingula anatina TaxID=7574 RepID=A0A1S3ISB5_LINAN|nr:uncharacterized protein LOC106166730 isoform X2 [Lingula anatina]|eukprot:XP_013400831.1 uncharacterized protein LOC106166730 isoform X2 [Lingula anatina]